MLKAIYAGSYDPVTKGHLDIIERAARMVDVLVVAILENPNKRCLFTLQERKQHMAMVTKHIKNIEIVSFSGLLVDFAKKADAKILIRGVRTVEDFENEFQRALINKTLDSEIETLFIAASMKHLTISSSAVKEIATFGGEIDFMVPKEIKQFVIDKYKK